MTLAEKILVMHTGLYVGGVWIGSTAGGLREILCPAPAGRAEAEAIRLANDTAYGLAG